MAVRTAFGDGAKAGWIDRGLSLLIGIILLMAGVSVCVYGMMSFSSLAEQAASDASPPPAAVSDFGQADE
ncbi:MAG: hypothetical protein KDA93_17040 [Planctomycetaceae bacterium]|nr:hypothetical protein [Planctomycetaceae bacterium]